MASLGGFTGSWVDSLKSGHGCAWSIADNGKFPVNCSDPNPVDYFEIDRRHTFMRTCNYQMGNPLGYKGDCNYQMGNPPGYKGEPTEPVHVHSPF